MRLSAKLAAIGVLACAGPAWAQTAEGAAAGAMSAEATAPDGGSDAEVQSFARATVKLHGLTQPTPQQLGEVITGAGLSVDRYNEIAARMQKDPAFRTRVNEALVSAQKAGPGEASQSSAAPPPLPTTGPGASVLAVLDNVCLPMVRQDQPLAKAAPPAGLKLNRKDGSYAAPLGERPYSVSVAPRGANRNVCSVQIRHPLGEGDSIAKALNIWTMHQQPEMKMVRNDAAVGPDGLKRITLSWEQSGAAAAGLVFVRVQRGEGAPLEKGVGSATLLYSQRTG